MSRDNSSTHPGLRDKRTDRNVLNAVLFIIAKQTMRGSLTTPSRGPSITYRFEINKENGRLQNLAQGFKNINASVKSIADTLPRDIQLGKFIQQRSRKPSEPTRSRKNHLIGCLLKIPFAIRKKFHRRARPMWITYFSVYFAFRHSPHRQPFFR